MKRSLIQKTSFRKQLKKSPSKQVNLVFGSLGIQTLEAGFISEKALEQISTDFFKVTKKSIKLFIRTTINHPMTAKPSEVRMGKGKGSIKLWAAGLQKGAIFLEILGYCSPSTQKKLKKLCLKLPVKTRLVEHNVFS